MLEANRVIYVTLYSSDLRRRSDLQTTSTAWLLNRAGRAGEHIICVRTDEANRPHDQHQNDGQHHGVFGDVLSRIVRPQLTNQLVHSLSSRPLSVPREGNRFSSAPMMHAAQAPCQLRVLEISTENPLPKTSLVCVKISCPPVRAQDAESAPARIPACNARPGWEACQDKS